MTGWSNHPERDLGKARDMVVAGASITELLHFLRRDGFSKIESTKALVDLGLADLKDAKPLVHLSDAWADRRDSDEKFHSELLEVFDAISKTPNLSGSDKA